MKYLIYSLLVFLTSAAMGQTSSPDDVKTLEKLNEDWIHSYPGKDTATLGRIFADDLIMITPNGSRMSKKQILANTASPGQQVASAKVEKVQVKLVGNIGLVMAEASFISLENGKEVPGRTNYLDVYEKRNGRWVAIAAHVTFLGQ
jgi:ketosteroid isomerase-like protein